MACYYLSNGKRHRLTVKDYDAPITTTSGTQQLRNYSAGFVSSVQQDNITLTIQTKSNRDRLNLVQTLRASQKDILNTGTVKDVILWPERNIAYRVFPKNIPVQENFNITTQTLRLQFGIVTGLIETGLASFTGVDGMDSFGEDGWIDHVPKPIKEDDRFKDIFLPPPGWDRPV